MQSPLAPVTDYQSMLGRIFWFTSAAALVATWILRLHIDTLNELLNRIDFTVALAGDKFLPIPGGYLLPALAVGMLARIYRLHNRISDWLAIRESFDIDVIIRDLAAQLGIDLAHVSHEELAARRHHIMRTAFYPFVTGPQPQIDAGLVHQALDAWSWFWVGIEATCVFTFTGFTLIAAGARSPGLDTLVLTLLVAAIGLPTLRNQCRRYAHAQIRAILADPARTAIAQSAFQELTHITAPARHAA